MPLSPLEGDQDNGLRKLSEHTDPVEKILLAMLANESLCVVVHAAEAARVKFLDRLLPALRLDRFHIVRATSLGGTPLDLRCLMDQVVGPDCQAGTDRAEQFFTALMTPEPGETRLAVIIDDAHLLTDQTLRYLGLIASVSNVTPMPLQFLLVGTQQLWTRLPVAGCLAADKVSTSISLADEDAAPGPDAKHLAGPAVLPTATPAPVQYAAPKAALEHPVSALFSERTTPAEWPLASARSGMPASAGNRRKRSKAGRLAWAACAGVILFGSGLVAIQFRDQLLDRYGMMRHAAIQYVARWVGRSAPSRAGDAPRSAPPVAGAAAPAIADPTTPADLSDTANPASAQATARPSAPDPAAVPAVPISPTENDSGVNAGISDAPDNSEPPAPTALSETADPKLPESVVASPAATEEPPEPAVKPQAGTQSAVEPVATSGPEIPRAVAQPLSPAVVAALLTRGNALLASGDVGAARLLFERAAGSNSAAAAVAMGMTYDPRTLAQIGARGIAPNPQTAIAWYRRASDLGSAEGERLLTQIMERTGN